MGWQRQSWDLSITEMLRSPENVTVSDPGRVQALSFRRCRGGLGGNVLSVCCQEESRSRGAWRPGAVLWPGSGQTVCLDHCVESQDLQDTILQKLILFFPISSVSHCVLGSSRWMALILIWGANAIIIALSRSFLAPWQLTKKAANPPIRVVLNVLKIVGKPWKVFEIEHNYNCATEKSDCFGSRLFPHLKKKKKTQ